MLKIVDGVAVELTAEEIAAWEKFQAEAEKMPIPEPTPEERIAELEKIIAEQDVALMELASMLAGGV